MLATGAFDLLHVGHLRFLEASKRKGGPSSRLVVVVATDKTVRHRKGRNPIIPEDQRREIVGALRVVNRAILGRKDIDLLGILREVSPDILCFGHDQRQIQSAAASLIKRQKLPVRVVRIPHFGPRGLDSSTRVKRRIARSMQTARN